MTKTVDALSTEVTRAQTYLDRARGDRVKDLVQSLPSSADDGVVNLLGGSAR